VTATTALQPSFEELGTPLFDATFVVVDLETTGLSPGVDRITEIGAVKVRGGEVLGELQTLVHPGRPIPPAVTAVTGIDDRLVRGAPPVEAVLPTWLEFARDAVLVAHNARFDTSFLDAELRRHGYPPMGHVVLDTARIARRVLADEVRDVRLMTLARHLHARVLPEHRALTDARATVDVLHGLLERVGSLGATTLEDLRDYTRSTSDALFRKVSLVDGAPDLPGVYRFLDARGELLYVGKATSLRQRLRQYFGQDPRRRIADMVRDTARVEWTVTPTELEANVREVRAIVRHQPRYNRRSKHPQRAVWLKLTRERFPRLSIVTAPRDAEAAHLGPVTSRRTAEQLVDAIHEVLPIRRCSMRIRLAQDHATCVLKDLGRCGSPCDGTQSAEDYDAVVAVVRGVLEGDAAPLLDALRSRMEGLAADARFEQAARLRRRLHASATVLSTAHAAERLAGVAEVCALRRSADRAEVVLARHGRLAATAVVGPDADDDEAAAAARLAGVTPVASGPPTPEDAEELRLVRTWLDRPGTRVLWATDGLAEPVGGGAALARTRREARSVARQVSRDRQVLSGTKVVRRGEG
jgi:DNA polymerase-3 subunit epsilon